MKNSIKHIYHIAGMSCGGCAASVKNKLSAVIGVRFVQVDLAKKEAEITSSDVIKVDTLQDALNNTDFTIVENRTD
jgi:copper chaperone CopZ